ncbi:histidinol-phosphate aminotransferase [Dissulfurispira thermophila]|uniref:Histidinol-phosphate aminotransferase n=2 Tax=root TaxID=1 RepID=A0A7G1GYE4_9BACT|nr:histidinol-phosphate transaminase [Dissulfurispira thermophila]BCB95384.1 histidinol-phosphate aminotransferase [Dissulfurispira thermophila]
MQKNKRDNKINPLKYISEIEPYVPGKPIKELERELGIKGSIKLASNENPLGPSQKALKALHDFLYNGSELSRYPDGSGFYLKSAISEKIGISAEDIILGNGSNELIDIAVRTFMGIGDEAVMAKPSFIVYSMATKSVGAIPIEVPLIDYRHNLMAMADAITEKTKIVFIANPNNPTGTINKRDEFERFLEKIPNGILIVIDEAYYEYVMDPEYPDTIKYLMDGRDVLILRTFSKAYGLAGLRIGYGIASRDIIREMNKVRNPFNTNTLAQLSAMNALTDNEHLKKTIEINEQGKEFLYRELESIKIKYIPTEANFIYMLLDIESKIIYQALLKKGVIVRPVGPKEIRVTIGLPEENNRFIEALKVVINSLSN